jgi:hypothetical protein
LINVFIVKPCASILMGCTSRDAQQKFRCLYPFYRAQKKDFQLIAFFRFVFSSSTPSFYHLSLFCARNYSIFPSFLSFSLSLLLSPVGYWSTPYLFCPFFPLHDTYSPSHKPGMKHDRKLDYTNKKEHMLNQVSFILWERGLSPFRRRRFLSSM